MKTDTLFVFNFARFFQAGTTFSIPAAGIADANNLPDATDDNWISIPNIVAHAPSFANEVKYEKKGPVVTPAGVKVLTKDIIRAGEMYSFKLTLNEISPLVVQAFYRTQNLTDTTTQANLHAGNPPKGWLKLQQIDQAGAVVQESDFFVEITTSGGMDATYDKPIEPELTCTVLYSPLASMGF